MSRFGTGLSRFLYVVMLAGLGLVAIGVLAALVTGALALFDPDALAGVTTSVNGQPIRLRQPERGLSLAGVVLLVCAWAGALLWQLIGMLRSAAAGAPFTQANVRRLRMLAALFAAVFAVQLGALLLPQTVKDVLNMSAFRLDLNSLFAALLTLVLAEVFRAGVALREDAEGTI